MSAGTIVTFATCPVAGVAGVGRCGRAASAFHDAPGAIEAGRGRPQRAETRKGESALNTIFALSPLLLLVAFAAFALLSLLLSLLALGALHRRWTADARILPVAPFFTAVTTIWALSLGFAAADLWGVRSQAEQAASAERSSISRLHGMSERDALDAPQLREALAAYVGAVAQAEWGETANAQPAEEVERALQSMRLAIIELARTGTPPALMAKMAQDFDELQDARNTRLAIGVSSVSEYKWYLVLVLTVMSMIAIAAVHADRPPAGRWALAIFAVAATASLWILALYANPYSGGARITFHPPAVTAG